MKKYILINEGLAEEPEVHQATPGIFTSVSSAYRAFKSDWSNHKTSKKRVETGTILFQVNGETQTFCVPIEV